MNKKIKSRLLNKNFLNDVACHVIIEEEVLDLILHLRFTFIRLIHQYRPIGDSVWKKRRICRKDL